MQPQFHVFRLIEHETKRHAADLADDGSDGRARNAHSRAAQQTEDHNGVQNDVDDRARQLGHHGQHRVAGSLHHALKADAEEQTEAENAHDAQILAAQRLQLQIVREQV